MDDIEVIFEKLETFDHASSDSTEDAFRNTHTLKFIKAASIHTLHTIIDTGLDKESAVEFHDFRSDGLVKDLKLHHDSVELGLVKLKTNFLRGVEEWMRQKDKKTHLHGHIHVGWDMKDLFDGSIIALAEFLVELELVHADAEFGTVGEIDAIGMKDSLAVEVEGT